ncbi:MAG TPA: CBS domain-containing protein [Verrucomicrobiae bacterium]|nr:CBS domain-containing protein [Verrucomicrobiae bacterium]
MKIKELMVSPVITVQEDDPFSKVEEKFRTKGIRHLPVVDSGGLLKGIVTQRDLYRTLSPRLTEEGIYYAPEALDEFVLKRVMKQEPVALGPDDELAKAVEIMARNKFGAIPVVDKDRKVVGILTETDILKWLARQL